MAETMTLEEAVSEVHNILTGLDLTYDDRYDIFHATVRQLNRSLRAVALLEDWGWYVEELDLGLTTQGMTSVEVDRRYRPRVGQDDAVRLIDPNSGLVRYWAYYLPRDSINKYAARRELRVAFTKNTLTFSRPLQGFESGLSLRVTCMREPRQTRIPPAGEELTTVELTTPIDFSSPDLVVAHAVWQISMSNPVYQPRAQTLESIYDDLRFSLTERDSDHSDSPYRNNFTPSYGDPYLAIPHRHPHSDRR